jgi:hypothetical protein
MRWILRGNGDPGEMGSGLERTQNGLGFQTCQCLFASKRARAIRQLQRVAQHQVVAVVAGRYIRVGSGENEADS